MSEQGGFKEIGLFLGVTGKQAHAWYARRQRNGFPESVGPRVDGDRRQVGAPLFDMNEVAAWHKNYVPSKGGRTPESWVRYRERRRQALEALRVEVLREAGIDPHRRSASTQEGAA